MSDALSVEQGRAPWAPVAQFTSGEVLDFYNVPRAGLLHANGLTYFYSCLAGDGEPMGIWVYVHINDQEMRQLLAAKTPEESDAVTTALIDHRWVTVAAAANDRIIEATVLHSERGPIELIRQFVKHLDEVVHNLRGMVDASGLPA